MAGHMLGLCGLHLPCTCTGEVAMHMPWRGCHALVGHSPTRGIGFSYFRVVQLASKANVEPNGAETS
ncbi:hypothetical protein V6N12_020284 [Hibiscus sabdariffa]|uniref:Secreted protein n=1 Tax=Hibiscus sabdariffa TaxID=183260 RepID=A0ABR2BUW4_9ROSI